MAYPRFSPPSSVAQQIRTTTLGVSDGGVDGRMSQIHKGVGLNQNKGGLNIRGSARMALVPRATVPRVVARRPQRPAPAVVPRPSRPVSWDSLSSYTGSVADIGIEAANQRASLQRQLADNASAFDRGVSDGKRSFEQGLGDAVDALNRQGLLRSGSRETADADAVRQFDRFMEDLSAQHGPMAAARINEELARIDQWATEKRLAAEQAARAEYERLYPATPIPQKQADAPAASGAGRRLGQSGLDASIFKGGYLKSWDAQKKRNVYRSLEKLTREEILRMLARPANQKILASGWKFVDGRIVRG